MDAPLTPQRPPDGQADDPADEPEVETHGLRPGLIGKVVTGCGLALIVTFVLLCLSGFVIEYLIFRQLSQRDASEEAMTRIDGAVQQYILKHELQGIQGFIALHGTVVADWDDPDLVGPNGYLRVLPTCPFGGRHYIQDYEQHPSRAPVISVNKRGEHVADFPGY